MTNITEIVTLVFRLVVLIATTFLVPYIRSKTTIEQQQKIKLYVKMAVQAAETMYQNHGAGAQKKQYVINYLAEHGFKLDGDELDVYIESAVLELKHAINE